MGYLHIFTISAGSGFQPLTVSPYSPHPRKVLFFFWNFSIRSKELKTTLAYIQAGLFLAELTSDFWETLKGESETLNDIEKWRKIVKLKGLTPLKINMEPKIWWFLKCFSFSKILQVPCSFSGVLETLRHPEQWKKKTGCQPEHYSSEADWKAGTICNETSLRLQWFGGRMYLQKMIHNLSCILNLIFCTVRHCWMGGADFFLNEQVASRRMRMEKRLLFMLIPLIPARNLSFAAEAIQLLLALVCLLVLVMPNVLAASTCNL